MIRLNASRPASAALEFVGLGAARCGTTWLADCLREHPSVFVPRRKELKYFDNDRLFDPSLRLLRRHFAAAGPGQCRGEISPRYLASDTALDRLAATCPAVKVLVSLRDPVERLFSDYCYMRFNMKQDPNATLEEALRGRYGPDYLRRSRYARSLERAFDLFGRARVHVLLFEDIAARPREVLRAVFSFLGVDESFVPAAAGETVNRSGHAHRAPRRAWARFAQWIACGGNPLTRLSRPLAVPVLGCAHGLIDAWGPLQDGAPPPRLDAPRKARLYAEHFREDVERTQRLLGRDLSAWRR
jgi:hypothetical protein